MATAAAVEDAITCCICFNVYRDPHALPCLHTLCKPCVDQLAVGGKVECPECREISDVRKIRKDFKTQSLIDAHNGKSWESGGGISGIGQVCGMCSEPNKQVNSHCKECECFMCVSCEKAHKAIKVCRGHTVKAVKDIVQIAQSKLEAYIDQWKAEQFKITTKARKIDSFVKNVQDEAKTEIQLTNKHFKKLIHDLEIKQSALVNEITKANESTVKNLWKNKEFYEELCREIQSKIDMMQDVINGKHSRSTNNMVDDMDESLNEQVIDISRRVDSLDVQGVLPVKLCIDKKGISIATGIQLEITRQYDVETAQRLLMLNGNYFKLKTNRYELSGSQDFNNRIDRINFINNNIWCAATSNGIQIYDQNLKLVNKIKHTNYEFVTGLAEWGKHIIVACFNTGLHQITQSGDYVQKITGGTFSDVSSNGKYIYGLKCIKPHKIVIFTHERNKWTKKGSIQLTDDKKPGILDKLIANANSLFISLCEEKSIEKYSLEGELQQTFGCEGTLTWGLSHPVICGVDVHENLLVADFRNNQLKVYYSEEQSWHVLPFMLFQPLDAVMDENNIWVVTSGWSSQILKFTKI